MERNAVLRRNSRLQRPNDPVRNWLAPKRRRQSWSGEIAAPKHRNLAFALSRELTHHLALDLAH
uniref:Uncharacterized protein n=1 Tax=Romanomermis culicivorax TaxID=13658 RepID=A0A915I4T5_ROMCU